MIFINKKQRYAFYLLFLTFLSADIKIFCETPINSPQEITNTSDKDGNQKNSTENHKDKNVKKNTTKNESTSLSSQLFYLTGTLIIGATSLITGGIAYLILAPQATENQSTLDKKLHKLFQYGRHLPLDEEVEAILKNGADATKQDKHGRTALHKTFLRSLYKDNNYASIVKILIKYGANVNEQDKNGDTPLHWAAQLTGTYKLTNLKKGVKKLIKYGADVNKKNKDGKTALDCLLKFNMFDDIGTNKKQFKIAKILFKHWAKIPDKGNPLYKAMRKRFKSGTYNRDRYYSLKLADLLIKNGANLNKKEKYKGNTPFHVAAKFFDVSKISNLISKGAKMNTKNNLGTTPATIISKRFGYLKTLALYKEQLKYHLRSCRSKIIKKSKTYVINKIANLK